jgi:ABC-type branched-subunit amino acid transport system substrate-binding protein
MPSQPRFGRPRVRAAVLGLGLGALSLAGCASDPVRPTTPTYSGAYRPDPSSPPRPGAPLEDYRPNPFAQSRDAYDPRFLPANAQIRRVAVLLPFSSTDAEVRRLTQGLFNAVQMALFEVDADNVVLVPKDTGADVASVQAAAEEAVREGAVAVIGPVFAQQVPVVAGHASQVNAPVFSFSTDVSALGKGAYLVSLTPTSEVERIVEWAKTQGVSRVALFGPNSQYGRAVEAALRSAAAKRDILVVSAEFYQPGNSSPQAEARRLAAVVKAENAANPGKVAVLIPERGVQLRTVASLLPYFDVNLRQVKFLGTGAWNDPDIWREPALFGGAFPAPDPAAVADFEARYQATYGEAPPRLAGFGYDAGALAATLAKLGRLDADMIERGEGWSGVNGLFRFGPDGSNDRALTVMQVQNGGGVKVVSPALSVFTPGS